MYKKIIFGLFFFCVLAFGNVFASGQSDENADEVNLDIFHFKVPWIDSWAMMEDAYEESHQGVKIETEIVGGGADWRTQLKTKFAAGKGPDIFIIEGYSDYMLWKEFIEPLTGESWITHLMPNAKEAAVFDGNVVGMPLGLEGYGYIYNKDLFKTAGINNVPRTLSELTEAVAKLNKSGVIPFASGFGTWWVISNHLGVT